MNHEAIHAKYQILAAKCQIISVQYQAIPGNPDHIFIFILIFAIFVRHLHNIFHHGHFYNLYTIFTQSLPSSQYCQSWQSSPSLSRFSPSSSYRSSCDSVDAGDSSGCGESSKFADSGDFGDSDESCDSGEASSFSNKVPRQRVARARRQNAHIYININTLYCEWKVRLGGSGGSERVMGEWLVGRWIVA